MREECASRFGPCAFVSGVVFDILLCVIESGTHLIGQLGVVKDDGLPQGVSQSELFAVGKLKRLLKESPVNHGSDCRRDR